MTKETRIARDGLALEDRACGCDFCSGRKKWSDNWCGRCAEVQLVAPKWWENMDLCDACEQLTIAEVDALDPKQGAADE